MSKFTIHWTQGDDIKREAISYFNRLRERKNESNNRV
jgi:hypothetical protein